MSAADREKNAPTHMVMFMLLLMFSSSRLQFVTACCLIKIPSLCSFFKSPITEPKMFEQKKNMYIPQIKFSFSPLMLLTELYILLLKYQVGVNISALVVPLLFLLLCVYVSFS